MNSLSIKTDQAKPAEGHSNARARGLIVSCLCTALLAVILAADCGNLLPTAAAQTGLRQTEGRKPTLRERLVLGLRARRPSEIAFIDAVVDSVNRGDLPKKVVDQTFFWARRKSPLVAGQRARRPIIYFQPALRALAKRLNFTIRSNP